MQPKGAVTHAALKQTPRSRLGGIRDKHVACSGKLLQVEAELKCLPVRQQIFPGHFALLIPGHAAQHAAQRRLHACGDLVVRRARDNAGDEGPILVPIGIFQVIEEAPLAANCPSLARCLRTPAIPMPCCP